MNKKMIHLSLIASMLVIALPAAAESQLLEISLLDVGLGESILIQCPESNTATLIDAGDSNDHYPGAERLFRTSLMQELKSNSSLSLAINTHAHCDHRSGFLWLFSQPNSKRISIKTFIDNGPDQTRPKREQQMHTLVLNRGIRYIDNRQAGLSEVLICPQKSGNSENVRLEILKLTTVQAEKLGCPANLNDCSIIMKLMYGKFSLLLTADATERWEQAALADASFRQRLKSSVLKVGHHGSSSTSEEFLRAVDPDAAILSPGKGERGAEMHRGSPSAEVIDRLNRYFSLKQGKSKKESKTIYVCKREARGCGWEKRSLHPSLLSTAASGTIRLSSAGESFELGNR